MVLSMRIAGFIGDVIALYYIWRDKPGEKSGRGEICEPISQFGVARKHMTM